MTILPVRTRSSAANFRALDRMYSVFPVWQRVERAQDALDLPSFTLLHAGPPFKDPCAPSSPVLSSASLCAVYEGWATTPDMATQLIRAGKIRLVPAQDFSVVTPLAAVISPSAYLVEVVDVADKNRAKCWSELSTGPGPMLRFGTQDRAILQRMCFREEWLAPRLRRVLDSMSIPLFPHAMQGLISGDDLHASTSSATRSLADTLQGSAIDSGLKRDIISLLNETPLFFLNLWMAACHLMLGAMAQNEELSTLVIALAGNGQECGIRVSGAPAKWMTAPAGSPSGKIGPHERVSGVLGDSGCIDAAGFGAQQWISSWVTNEKPASLIWPDREAPWGVGRHPFFFPRVARCAIDITQITHSSLLPHIAIAMLDEQGKRGLLGKGIYKTDKAMYQPRM